MTYTCPRCLIEIHHSSKGQARQMLIDHLMDDHNLNRMMAEFTFRRAKHIPD